MTKKKKGIIALFVSLILIFGVIIVINKLNLYQSSTRQMAKRQPQLNLARKEIQLLVHLVQLLGLLIAMEL